MNKRQKQELIEPADQAEKQMDQADPQELSHREWLVLIVLYPLAAPLTKKAKPNRFKRLLEILSALLKIAGMAYGLYQAVMGAT